MAVPAQTQLRITEIFYSLQGEARTVGCPTVFIRLTGCPLRCGYCDTEYAFTGGQWMSQQEILEQVRGFGAHFVTVTGGEPLAQKGCPDLLRELCEQGYEVSVETSGALDICALDQRVIRVMDLKTPASGEQDRNRLQNLDCLRPQDQVKFVIQDRADYDWAKHMCAQYQLAQRCEVLFSPVYESLAPRQLADWILADRLPVRFQIQLHKILWGEAPGH